MWFWGVFCSVVVLLVAPLDFFAGFLLVAVGADGLEVVCGVCAALAEGYFVVYLVWGAGAAGVLELAGVVVAGVDVVFLFFGEVWAVCFGVVAWHVFGGVVGWVYGGFVLFG